jgi:hypothetical protein
MITERNQFEPGVFVETIRETTTAEGIKIPSEKIGVVVGEQEQRIAKWYPVYFGDNVEPNGVYAIASSDIIEIDRPNGFRARVGAFPDIGSPFLRAIGDQLLLPGYHWCDESALNYSVYRCNFIIDEYEFMVPAYIYGFGDNRIAKVSDQVKAIFLHAGWDGSGRLELIWIPPFAFSDPEGNTKGLVVWHAKQSRRHGVSWIASREKLRFAGLNELTPFFTRSKCGDNTRNTKKKQ